MNVHRSCVKRLQTWYNIYVERDGDGTLEFKMAYMMDMTKIGEIEEIVEAFIGRDVTPQEPDSEWTFQFGSAFCANEAIHKIGLVGDGWFAKSHEYVVNRIVAIRKCS